MNTSAPRLLFPARPRIADALAAIDALPRDEQAESFRCHNFSPRGYIWSAKQGDRRRWVPFPDIAPSAAWEAFADRGVIPAAWRDSDDRLFTRAYDSHGENLRRWWSAQPYIVLADQSQWEAERRPTSLSDALALAADPDGITTAEDLARSVCAISEGHHPARIVWRVVPLDPLRSALQYRSNRWGGVFGGFTGSFGDAVVHMAAWPMGRFVHGADVVKPSLPPEHHDLATRLLATGYAPLAFARDVVVMVCPAIEWAEPR